MVVCRTYPVLIINLVAGIVTITALLIMPSWMWTKYKDFNVEPVNYYGCNFKRAAAVTLSIALLAIVSIIVYYIVLFIDMNIGAYAGGVAVFMSLFTFMFAVCYANSMRRTLGTMESLIDGGSMEWTVTLSYKERLYEYDYRDWGHWYEDCATKFGQDPSEEPPLGNISFEITKCMSRQFSAKAAKYASDIKLIIYLSIAIWAFVFFFVNGQPLMTLAVLVLLALVSALLAFPIYCTALYNRNLQRIIIESSGLAKTYKGVMGLSWGATFCLILGSVLLVVTVFGGPLPIICGLILEVSMVALIFMLTRRGLKGLMREYYDLTLTGIPHYIITGVFLLLVIVAICKACKSGDDPDKSNEKSKKEGSSSSSSSSSSSISISTSAIPPDLSSSEMSSFIRDYKRRKKGCY